MSMTRYRSIAILACILIMLLMLSAVAVAAPVKFTKTDRFSKSSQSYCPTCSPCLSCAATSSISLQEKNLPATITGLNLPTFKFERPTNIGWNALYNPPLGCAVGNCG